MYDDLEEFISKYDILCLCETFCISEDYENPLHDQNSIHNYTLIHKPRDKCSRASGGLCCAINNDFINTEISIQTVRTTHLSSRMEKESHTLTRTHMHAHTHTHTYAYLHIPTHTPTHIYTINNFVWRQK